MINHVLVVINDFPVFINEFLVFIIGRNYKYKKMIYKY